MEEKKKFFNLKQCVCPSTTVHPPLSIHHCIQLHGKQKREKSHKSSYRKSLDWRASRWRRAYWGPVLLGVCDRTVGGRCPGSGRASSTAEAVHRRREKPNFLPLWARLDSKCWPRLITKQIKQIKQSTITQKCTAFPPQKLKRIHKIWSVTKCSGRRWFEFYKVKEKFSCWVRQQPFTIPNVRLIALRCSSIVFEFNKRLKKFIGSNG